MRPLVNLTFACGKELPFQWLYIKVRRPDLRQVQHRHTVCIRKPGPRVCTALPLSEWGIIYCKAWCIYFYSFCPQCLGNVFTITAFFVRLQPLEGSGAFLSLPFKGTGKPVTQEGAGRGLACWRFRSEQVSLASCSSQSNCRNKAKSQDLLMVPTLAVSCCTANQHWIFL